ncbi:MAG: cysteine dioxygenase [Proteobacteria bacterium]|nr:cysteine dioxygenase [Pseudomonadota bacterium]MBI3498434.1 cysteine dioxygenase [Pseudomonadota bacterium]
MDQSLATDRPLGAFIDSCRGVIAEHRDAADRVTEIAPLMQRLVAGAAGFLENRHLISNPSHYARNAIYICPSGDLSLFALVWLPGQWTPVHDHGSWGVVGVVEGVLEERAYMAADGEINADSGIRLRRGGIVLLNAGAITTFVPNPDHIHMTGVAAGRERCVSLHLYGRNMDSFHIYDVDQGTRRLIDVPHYQSH